MKILIVPAIAVLFAWSFSSCSSSSGPATFCDTVCLKDSIKFIKKDHPLQPYVYISANNCLADTLTWSYDGMGANRKLGIEDLFGAAVRLNKNAINCYIKDTSYAWLAFNDCSNERGYLLKIPFNKRDKMERKSSGINSFDPKFSVADGLIAYTDKGNIFIEDIDNGKSATMTFGQPVDIDYDNIHQTIDSVNITRTHAWVKINIDNEWKEIEKNIELK